MNPLPSTTFLFDPQRTGRMPFSKGNRKSPELVWSFLLPSYAPKGPESSPAFDSHGNIYFGCHDGCFYSLNSNGELRWMFKTEAKIYSSPAIYNGMVVFCSGDGHCFCFDFDGTLKWVYFASDYFDSIKNRLFRKTALLRTKMAAKDPVRRKSWSTKCWTSPNISAAGVVYVTAFGVGLHALSIDDGSLLWVYDLGSPRNHLSGVALNNDEDIFVASQRKYIHRISSSGKCQWRINVRNGFDSWGNPSIDSENGNVFFPFSRQETEGYIVAVNYDGDILWRSRIPGGIRGSVAISYLDYLLAGGLDGNLYFINKLNGELIKTIHLTNAERGLWTTPSIDLNGNIYITTKDSRFSGSLYCLDPTGKLMWRYELGKALSTPVFDADGKVYLGSWTGEFICLQS